MFSGHLLFAVLMEGWVLHDPHPLLLSLVNMHVQVASRFQLSPRALNSFWCIIRPNRFNLKMEIFIKFSSENRSYITKIKKKKFFKAPTIPASFISPPRSSDTFKIPYLIYPAQQNKNPVAFQTAPTK